MSLKFRNKLRAGFTRNFSTYCIKRYIMIDDDKLTGQQKKKFVSKINEMLWKEIQEVNMIVPGRILPFVNVYLVEKINNELRVIINDLESDTCYCDYETESFEKIPIESLSHLINFRTVPPRRLIEVSDCRIPGSAKMIIGEEDQISAAVDIFIDIAMFHSFDPLNEFDLKQRKQFSINKYQFMKNNDFSSYYECNHRKPPVYWSLAFSVRDGHNSMDHFAYVKLWEMFLEKYYPNILIEDKAKPDVAIQLKKHIDIGNIENKYFDKSFWSSYPSGDYIFCRINKDPHDNKRKKILMSLFEIDKFHIGATAIFPMSHYHIKSFNRELRELNISAFKIVV